MHTLAHRRGTPSFTLTELLVVIGLMAILASLLLPAWSSAKQQARRVQCLNHQRQLAVTWVLYCGDFNETLVPNGAQQPGGPTQQKLWVLGDYHNFVPAFTNEMYLLDSRYAAFAPYLRTKTVYKCPSDRTTFVVNRGRPIPQVRSYSLNLYLAPIAAMNNRLSTRYRVFRKAGDIPAPAHTFAFMDVTPQNLCTPAFIVSLPGIDHHRFFHLPATHHNRGGVVSFADGHAEARRWQDPRTFRYARPGTKIGHDVFSPNNPDLAWIQERTTLVK